MTRHRLTASAPRTVRMTVTVSVATYESMCAQAGCSGISAATRAARILEAHDRALNDETRRDPRDYRLDV